MKESIIASARRRAGLSQDELARRSGTSRPTLSAYERGRKSPTLDTLTRIVAATGHDLAVVPQTLFAQHTTRRGRPVYVPTRLPRLPLEQAFAAVSLPLHLAWSHPGSSWDLAQRADRAAVYEIVLREGGPADILSFIDGALLLDLWDELVLPREIRSFWMDTISVHRRDSVA